MSSGPVGSSPAGALDIWQNNPSQVDQSQYFGKALSSEKENRFQELEAKGSDRDIWEETEYNNLASEKEGKEYHDGWA